MIDHSRIADLEAALRETIVYLRALPLHPATTRQADAAEDVLNQSYSSVLQAGVRYSYGALVIGAQLDGMKLTLKTEPQHFSPAIQKSLENGLQARLVRGICLELKHATGQFDPAFFDINPECNG